MLNDSLCSGSKPFAQGDCNYFFPWFSCSVADWGSCSVACGDDIQSRQVYCQSYDGKIHFVGCSVQ